MQSNLSSFTILVIGSLAAGMGGIIATFCDTKRKNAGLSRMGWVTLILVATGLVANIWGATKKQQEDDTAQLSFETRLRNLSNLANENLGKAEQLNGSLKTSKAVLSDIERQISSVSLPLKDPRISFRFILPRENTEVRELRERLQATVPRRVLYRDSASINLGDGLEVEAESGGANSVVSEINIDASSEFYPTSRSATGEVLEYMNVILDFLHSREVSAIAPLGLSIITGTIVRNQSHEKAGVVKLIVLPKNSELLISVENVRVDDVGWINKGSVTSSAFLHNRQVSFNLFNTTGHEATFQLLRLSVPNSLEIAFDSGIKYVIPTGRFHRSSSRAIDGIQAYEGLMTEWH